MKKHNPHDQFFIQTFTDENNMRVFLKNTLPPELIELIDLNVIEYETDTHIDPALHKNVTDLVVKTQVNSQTPVDIYFLFEHKSVYDDKILFQILRYMTTMWEKDLNEKKKPRIIIPFIFYHGKKKWKLKKLSEMLTDNQSIQKWLIDIPYLLFDTGKNVADFSEAMRLKVSIEMLKRAFVKNIDEIKEILEMIDRSGILEDELEAESFMFYFFKISDLETEEFMSIISNDLSINRKSEVKMVSLYDRLITKGKQEGKQEGAFAKAVETCKKALLAGAPVEFIVQITDLPLEKVLEIQKSLKIN
ncbi:MAG TPA: Rpn family recombination-promoting nuclease/putative transposase [bacterium]|nr:Rpn family recombination-promoting nuclease/putative transposase [bacterium]